MDKLVKLFIGSLYGYSNYTIRSYRNTLNMFVAFMAPLTDDVAAVTIADIERYRDAMQSSGMELSTQRCRLGVVRSFLKHCRKMGYIPFNPANEVFITATEKQLLDKSFKGIEPDVMERLFTESFGLNRYTRLRNLIVLCLLGRRGLRPIEVCRLLVKDFIDPCIRVVKKSSTKVLELDAFTLGAMREYLSERMAYIGHWRGSRDEHLVCAAVPRENSFAMTMAGIGAIVRRIGKEAHERFGTPVRGLNANSLCSTAKLYDWIVEDTISPAPHFEGASSMVEKGRVREFHRVPSIIYKDMGIGI